MGVTTDALNDMLKRGDLASNEFLPKFAQRLRDVVRETGALQAALDSVRTSRTAVGTLFQINISKAFGKASGGLKSFFDSLSKALYENTALFEVFGTVANGFFRGLAVIVDPIAVMLKGFGETIKSVFELVQVGQSLNNLRLAMDGVSTATKWVVWAFFKLGQAWYYLLGALIKEEGAMDKLKGMFNGLFDGALGQAKDMLADLRAILELGGKVAKFFNPDKPTTGGFLNAWDRSQEKAKELRQRIDSVGKPANESARASMSGTIVRGGPTTVEVVIENVSFTAGSNPREAGKEFGLGIGDGIAASGSLP